MARKNATDNTMNGNTPSIKECIASRLDFELAERYKVPTTITEAMYKRAVALLNGNQASEWEKTKAMLRKVYTPMDTAESLQRQVLFYLERERADITAWLMLESTEPLVNLALLHLEPNERAKVANKEIYSVNLLGANALVDQEGFIHFSIEEEQGDTPPANGLAKILKEDRQGVEIATREYFGCVEALYRHLKRLGASQELTASVKKVIFKKNQEIILGNYFAPKYTGTLPTPKEENNKELETEGYVFYKDARINAILRNRYDYTMKLEEVLEQRKGQGAIVKKYLIRWEE